MRFEKIEFDLFKKDMSGFALDPDAVRRAYDSIQLPERATEFSAGYDFYSPLKFYLPAGASIVIPSGIRSVFKEAEKPLYHIKLYIRSSIGINDHIILTHGTGVIDPDYMEGIKIPLLNLGSVGKRFEVGDRIIQGIIERYRTVDNDHSGGIRRGGIGSTGK